MNEDNFKRELKERKNFKELLSGQSEDFYDYETFGDLKVGERFITFPLPGDNSGHGGFHGPRWIFTKTEMIVTGPEGDSKRSKKLRYTANSHGRALNEKHNSSTDFILEMPVIKVA